MTDFELTKVANVVKELLERTTASQSCNVGAAKNDTITDVFCNFAQSL